MKKNTIKWAWTDEIEEINKMKNKKKMRSIDWDWRGDSKKKDKMLNYKMKKNTPSPYHMKKNRVIFLKRSF